MAWKVGLVTDNEAIQHLFTRTFEGREDISLKFYESAAEALKGTEKEPPDVLIISVSLPDEDGYELCREFKDSLQVGYPVLLIEDIFEDIDLDRCLEVHTDGFVSKPFEEELISEKIEEVLQTLEATPSRKGETGEPEDVLREAPTSSEEEEQPAVMVVSDGGEDEDILELTDLVEEEEIASPLREEGLEEQLEEQEVPPSIASALEESVSELEKMEALEPLEEAPDLFEEEEGILVSPSPDVSTPDSIGREDLRRMIRDVVEEVVKQAVQKSLEEKLPDILKRSLAKVFFDLSEGFK